MAFTDPWEWAERVRFIIGAEVRPGTFLLRLAASLVLDEAELARMGDVSGELGRSEGV